MPTVGDSVDTRDRRSSSTTFRVARATVGGWALMQYPDDEIADECHPDADADVKQCASCGEEIDPTRRHPAAIAPNDPSTVYLFCGDDCRAAWMDGGSDD